MTIPIEIIDADQDRYLPEIRSLFEAYRASLDIDLCFQQFDEELETLPGKYAPPGGCLLMARANNEAAGCIALKPLEEGACEMKRLYVSPDHRGLKVGRKLVVAIIKRAKDLGYKKMRLDTLPTMERAVRLYESIGFYDTTPYCFNPTPGVRFLELDLQAHSPTI